MTPLAVYRSLLRELGPQGWWPVTHEGPGPSYHPGDYSFPRTQLQQWEICAGAILTQNTAWKNVEKALVNLRNAGIWSPEAILEIQKRRLEQLINPSGFFRQKAERLRIFAEEVRERGVKAFLKKTSRDDLLSIKGIGPETADSILLYAGKRPFFVVDAYTRRMFSFPKKMAYQEIQELFGRSFPKDWRIYNEFHALIVQKGKQGIPFLPQAGKGR